jgi:hypothetical protein
LALFLTGSRLNVRWTDDTGTTASGSLHAYHWPTGRRADRGEPDNNYLFDGSMTFEHTGEQAVYAPNSHGLPFSDLTGPVQDSWEAGGPMVRSAYELHAQDDDFGPAGALVCDLWNDARRNVW